MKSSRRTWVLVCSALVLSVASFGAVRSAGALAATQSAVTPEPLASTLTNVGDTRDARARNLVVLDSAVFVLGVAILGGVLVWWGLRIYNEK